MLDDLLGRSNLKRRIEQLESERDRLQRRLDAETKRRKDAVRDRQSSDEQVNRLQDKIAELEDRVSRLQDDEQQIEFRGVETVTGSRCEEVIERLQSFSTEPEGALTAMITDIPDESVKAAIGDHISLVVRVSPCVLCTDNAGITSVALVPPITPDPFVTWGDGFSIERGWFIPEGSFTFALVRSDIFGLGEYTGTTRTNFEGFESDVKGKHSKGGFSQARFDRRRNDQIQSHIERCRQAIADRSGDRLIVTGERTLLGEFSDEAVTTSTVGATGTPETALDEAFREFWSTRLYKI